MWGAGWSWETAWPPTWPCRHGSSWRRRKSGAGLAARQAAARRLLLWPVYVNVRAVAHQSHRPVLTQTARREHSQSPIAMHTIPRRCVPAAAHPSPAGAASSSTTCLSSSGASASFSSTAPPAAAARRWSWASARRRQARASQHPAQRLPRLPICRAGACQPCQPHAASAWLPCHKHACTGAAWLQGCGKTTLCEQLEALFAYTGSTAASISIDDFYHTYQGQQAGGWVGGWVQGRAGHPCAPSIIGMNGAFQSPATNAVAWCPAVSAAHPGNPLLQMRGNAGSHDMQLGTDTLRALRGATSAGSSVPVPRCVPSWGAMCCDSLRCACPALPPTPTTLCPPPSRPHGKQIRQVCLQWAGRPRRPRHLARGHRPRGCGAV